MRTTSLTLLITLATVFVLGINARVTFDKRKRGGVYHGDRRYYDREEDLFGDDDFFDHDNDFFDGDDPRYFQGDHRLFDDEHDIYGNDGFRESEEDMFGNDDLEDIYDN